MFKKFMAFAMAVIILFGAVGVMYVKYLKPDDYPVFLESFGHGVLTVDSDEASGKDSKYMIRCKPGETLTVNINPERTEKVYYNLSKLVVNGIDVTDEVNMLQYKVEVNEKLNILATFKKGTKTEETTTASSVSYENEPDIIMPCDTEYLGSVNAYDFSDPSIIYDDKSGYYYCFGSSNVVARSKDLINWENRTTYFASPKGADSDAVMKFSDFPSVKKWAKTHGYDSDEAFSSANNNREPQSPDIVKIGSVYYLYFSLVKSKNANESAIFCVRTTDLAYSIENHDWQDAGLVISSCGYNSGTNKEDKKKYCYDESFATSASVFFDKDGALFMAYGSYCGKEEINGGIYLLELNPKTGLLKDGSKYNEQGNLISTLHGETRFNTGALIAKPGSVPALGKKQGSLVSECDILYNSNTDYYYLFVTYGDEESNYNIRVARSKNVDGPYTDYDGNSMAEFSSSKRKNQYTKGFMLLSGYNFTMSSGGGVSYTNVGKASTGCPSIVKTSDGKWLMASQSRVYYKVGDDIVTGDALAKENELSVDTAPALEIRQIFFNSDGWPLAVAEAYTGESAKKSVKASNMYGHWDVVVLDKSADEEDYTAVSRSVSQPVTIMNGIAISKKNIEDGTKLSKLKFEKNDKYSYNLLLDGVTYTIYPTVAWDWELSEGALVFSGTGSDGSTIFGKKNFSAFMGIYTDAYYYVLSQADEETQQTYNEKMSQISANPSQSKIDSMTKAIIKKILAE